MDAPKARRTSTFTTTLEFLESPRSSFACPVLRGHGSLGTRTKAGVRILFIPLYNGKPLPSTATAAKCATYLRFRTWFELLLRPIKIVRAPLDRCTTSAEALKTQFLFSN